MSTSDGSGPPPPSAPTSPPWRRVEEIIRRLDSGQAGLRETLDLVREGRELVEYCAGELDAVSQGLEELRLEELVTRLEGAQTRTMSTFDLLADLPLDVDGYALEGLSANVSSGFERLSTVVHLHGGGRRGRGRGRRLRRRGSRRPAGGRVRCSTWPARPRWPSSARGSMTLDLFPVAPQRGEVSRLYRRWTFHSAALDLALRQAGRPLYEVLGREPAAAARSSSRCAWVSRPR